MKKVTALIICILLVTGCSNKDNNDSKDMETERDKIQIGFCFDSFVIERWIRDRDIFVSTAQELGAEVNVQNANGDVNEQISQIRYLIGKGVDVLVITAVDCNKLTDVIQEAHNVGIKVISYDRLIQDANTDLYISFDSEMVGSLMAKELIKDIPEGGDIFMIQGPVEDNNVTLIKKGFEKEVKNSNINIVYEANCDGWLAEEAFEYVNEGLEENTEVRGIMCGNDDLASQVFRALAEKRLAGEVVLVGQDGELAACQRIVEGTQNMTVYKSVEQEATTAAKYAVDLAEGNNPTLEHSINDSTYDIPCVLLTPIAVTRENIDEVIIGGGFHLEEEVYLNITQ